MLNSTKSKVMFAVVVTLLFAVATILTVSTNQDSRSENKVIEITGTSKAELSSLQTMVYISEAKKWLQLTRDRADTYDIESHIGYLRENAKKANVSIEVIGTNENEIAELLTKGYISEARKWLQLARERAGTQDVKSHVVYLRKYTEKAGVAIEDIGTDEKELQSYSL